MRKFFKDQKALLGVIGFAILGMDHALAISAPDSGASEANSIDHILAAPQFSAANVRAHFFGDSENGPSASPEASIVFASSMDVRHRNRFIKSGVDGYGIPSQIRYGLSANTDGQVIFSGMGFDRSDDLNVTGYGGKAHDSADSLPNVVLFQQARGVSEKRAEKAEPDANAGVFTVPLPAAVWSFLVGLLGILGLKKRKQTSSDTAS